MTKHKKCVTKENMRNFFFYLLFGTLLTTPMWYAINQIIKEMQLSLWDFLPIAFILLGCYVAGAYMIIEAFKEVTT